MKVKLADVCTCESSNLKQSDVINISGNFPVYGATGKIGYIDTYKQKKPYIAIVKDGAGIGRTHLCDSKSSVIGTLQYILPKENVLPKYLFYVIKHMHLEKYYSGATIPHIYFKNYKNEEFNLDSINKQEIIINILNDCNKLINLKEAQLQKLDELVKARFVEMFGNPGSNEKEWKMNTFRDICTVRQGLQIPISDRLKHYEDDCYEYITVQYLHGGKDREYIKKPKSSVICTKNDILMTRTGNTGMVITGVEGVFHNNFFLIDFDRSRYDKDFLIQYLKLDIIQADILRRADTSTIPDLNHGEFYKINVFLPPIELQEQFSVFVQQVDKSKFRNFIPHKYDKYHQFMLVVLLLYIFILSYLM